MFTLECHVDLDIEGFEDNKGEPTGIKFRIL